MTEQTMPVEIWVDVDETAPYTGWKDNLMGEKQTSYTLTSSTLTPSDIEAVRGALQIAYNDMNREGFNVSEITQALAILDAKYNK